MPFGAPASPLGEAPTQLGLEPPVGRPVVLAAAERVGQILLVHASALNGAAFDAFARHLESRGYRFITLERALDDPAYALPDDYVAAGGISWIHRWAITQHKPTSMFTGEPEVPDWIAKRF